MKSKMKALYTLTMALSLMLAAGTFSASSYGSSGDGWQDTFNLEDCDFSSTGANDYFILEPGHQLVLQGQDEGVDLELIITVTNDTRVVDGVETRVVEERESEDGEIVEISRNYFAVCGPANDVFYFGEETDIYENDEIVSHAGAWLAGVDNATAGLIMPGNPQVGMKYYQEVAPGVAEDRAEVISLSQTANVPAGRFQNVLKTEETTPLEPDELENKFYAPGVGLIMEEELKLVSYVVPQDEEEEQPADGNGKPMNDQERKRRAVAARESGEQIHQRHMQANPASRGEYSPGLDYALEASGTAGEQDATLAMDISVWKSNGAVVIMDIVGGTATIGGEEYDIKVGYALYSIRHNVFRSAALAVADNGDVFALRLNGVADAEAELATAAGGAPVQLAFDGGAQSLGGWTLELDGTLQP
jgi:hypothetical protein